jgi:hypothetical protein
LLINSGVPTSVPTPTGYWDSGEAVTKQQKSLPFIEKNRISITDIIKISVPAFSFKPFSMVSVELHSEVQPLGEYQVQGDGSLEISISGQQYQSGTHSVHLLGENYTGASSDIYDFVDIQANESIAQNPNSNGTEQTTDSGSSPISSLTPLRMTPKQTPVQQKVARVNGINNTIAGNIAQAAPTKVATPPETYSGVRGEKTANIADKTNDSKNSEQSISAILIVTGLIATLSGLAAWLYYRRFHPRITR